MNPELREQKNKIVQQYQNTPFGPGIAASVFHSYRLGFASYTNIPFRILYNLASLGIVVTILPFVISSPRFIAYIAAPVTIVLWIVVHISKNTIWEKASVEEVNAYFEKTSGRLNELVEPVNFKIKK